MLLLQEIAPFYPRLMFRRRDGMMGHIAYMDEGPRLVTFGPADVEVRIAMWSGPRNISTALMRAWGSRDDTAVFDEPFYAHYLKETGIPHPGREEILAHQTSDWREVVRQLTGPIPQGKAIFYQKQMAHHLLPSIGRGWMRQVVHGFLIRDPREMLVSLAKVTPNPRVEDTGLPQQWDIFTMVQRESGVTPLVLDARDVLRHPQAHLRALCVALGVPFQGAMLAWKPGPRPTDGIWAKYWYAEVEASSGFQPYRPKTEELPAHLETVYVDCLEFYKQLYSYRLQPDLSETL